MHITPAVALTNYRAGGKKDREILTCRNRNRAECTINNHIKTGVPGGNTPRWKINLLYVLYTTSASDQIHASAASNGVSTYKARPTKRSGIKRSINRACGRSL